MAGAIGRGAASTAITAAVMAVLGAATAHAGSIFSGPEGWNTDNVAVGTGPDADGTFYSVVYDRAAADPAARTFGRITFDNDESFSPGIKVMNGGDQGSFGVTTLPGVPGSSLDNASNCIMASSATWCDAPRQTGKRWKQQITGTGPIDLVFNVDATDPTETEYRAFHRLVNKSGGPLGGFKLELGFGVGADFALSSMADGLSLAPRDDQNPTQYPFGLFGEEDNPDRPIGGFFDATARAGFETTFTEDSIVTGAIFGSYDDLFGAWLSQEEAPQGLLWDDDGDPTTDALVMAFLMPDTGEWQQRRLINALGEAETLVADPGVTGPLSATIEGVDLFGDGTDWTLDGTTFFQDAIEDVANLNVNYYVRVGDASQWSTFDGETATFTLRVTAQPVPVPAALPLLAAAAAGLVGLRLRRRA